MTSKRIAIDPEIDALVSQVRDLVGQAYRLSQDIDRTISDLDEYASKPAPKERDD